MQKITTHQAEDDARNAEILIWVNGAHPCALQGSDRAGVRRMKIAMQSGPRNLSAAMLRKLCAALGLDFTGRMLSWPAGGISEDGVWAAHWYGAVHRSTGFAGPKGRCQSWMAIMQSWPRPRCPITRGYTKTGFVRAYFTRRSRAARSFRRRALSLMKPSASF